MEKIKYPLFVKEDIDGFFALFQNNLANFVVIAISLIGMGFPTSIVYGKVIPGAAISVLVGNLYYSHMAKKLAEKENRTDVTALSYGISTPVMFIYLFGVMAPALTLTGDPDLAWKIGVAACFLGGVIDVLGSFAGNFIRKNIPRASMLGALAGVAFSVIGAQMFFNTYESPVVGILAMVIILIGFLGGKRMPFKVPTSLFAVLIGTILAYTLRQASLEQLSAGLNIAGFYPPLPTLGFVEGFKQLFGPFASMLAVILPISIYNYIETMNNVEAMAAAGDDYDTGECLKTDGIGMIIGSLFGGAFPTTVYIASVSAKWTKARRGYSIINGIVFFIASMFGIIAVLSEIIPLPVIAPILVFVGVSMVVQSFASVPKRHFPAVVFAMLPYIANYLQSNFDVDALNAVSPAVIPLGQGAMFTALIWGALVVFIVDNKLNKAAITAAIAALLAAIGMIHAPELSLFYDINYFIGYLIVAIVLIGFNLFGIDKTEEELMEVPTD